MDSIGEKFEFQKKRIPKYRQIDAADSFFLFLFGSRPSAT